MRLVVLVVFAVYALSHGQGEQNPKDSLPNAESVQESSNMALKQPGKFAKT